LATFCLSEVKLGIIPAVISPFVLEKIGPGHLRRYGLTGERFDAREAQRIGLISHVAATVEEMDRWIDEMGTTLQANGPKAMAAFKRTLSEVVDLAWDKVEGLTTRRIAELRVSPEGQEGLKAFLEKRKPNWT
jgi:methylglutaconyl-CoA hydratase